MRSIASLVGWICALQGVGYSMGMGVQAHLNPWYLSYHS